MAADTSPGRRAQATGPASAASSELSRRCQGAATTKPAFTSAIARSALTQGLLGEPCEITNQPAVAALGHRIGHQRQGEAEALH